MTPTIALTDLQARIETLEAEVKALKGARKGDSGKKANPRQPKPNKIIQVLLTNLTEAREKKDKKLMMKIRRNLRKEGYSLRNNNEKSS